MASKIDQKGSAEDLCDAFRVFDKDGKGLISVQELRYTRLPPIFVLSALSSEYLCFGSDDVR